MRIRLRKPKVGLFVLASLFAMTNNLSAQEVGSARPVVGPNIVYFHVDNLGMGELGCYGGGVFRGAKTPRIDDFAKQGFKLLNYAPESQCTPSRSALMTGRYSIRSGTHTVALAGSEGGLVAWEKTIADVLSGHGYASACYGKWHIGNSDGRWPTDKGFDEWYGPTRTYDEALWSDDPWYDPNRDPVPHMHEGRKGENVTETQVLTTAVKIDLDVEYLKRSRNFMRKSVKSGKPFFLYLNPTLMHFPTTPRDSFKGKSGHGEWADCLLQLDHDFGVVLDAVKELGIHDNTIVVFAGDNGPEEAEPWRLGFPTSLIVFRSVSGDFVLIDFSVLEIVEATFSLFLFGLDGMVEL